MNFFGHAVAATLHGEPHVDEPAFVLGAMLPDLSPLAGLRVARVDHATLAAGHAFHLHTDAAFHASPTFVAWTRRGSARLQELGVRRGPARGAAHLGAELLLDGWIAEARGVPESYRQALGAAPRLAGAVRFRVTSYSRPFPEVCAQVAAAPIPEAYARPAFVAERIGRILARRPRLALHDDERRAVELWAPEAAAEVVAGASRLLDELGAILARTRAA